MACPSTGGDHGSDAGFARVNPELTSGKATIRVSRSAAAIGDDELRDLARAAWMP